MALQTKTFTQQGDKGFSLKLVLTEESTSVTANTSLVSYAFYLVRSDNQGFHASQPFSWSISIGGTDIAISNFTFNLPTSKPEKEQLIKSGQVIVPHNADGTKTMGFDVSTPDASDVSEKYGPEAIRMTGNWKLTTIQRASRISAINAEIGSHTNITIYRASSAFTHTITYQFGDIDDGIVAENTGETTIQWPIPDDFYKEIPNAKSGTVTLTCQTYSGGSKIGDPTTTTFQVIASESACKPAIIGGLAITDETTLALTDFQAIRYISTIAATAEVYAEHHATITRVLINGLEAEKQADGRYRVVFERAEAWHYVFEVWDSRGYYNSTYVDVEMHAYIPFTCIPEVKRIAPTSKTVRLSIQGNFWAQKFSAENTNEMLLKYSYRKRGETNWSPEQTITPQIDPKTNTYTAVQEITGQEEDYESVWEWQIYGQDRAMHLTTVVTLPRGLSVYDWGADGFNFNVPISFQEKEIDLVIDEGTSGIWSYRKWLSGAAECYGTVKRTVTNWGSNSWGGVYNCANVSLPFGFVAVSSAMANAASGTMYAPCFGDPEEILRTNVANFNCCLPGSGQQTIQTNMMVVGRWK